MKKKIIAGIMAAMFLSAAGLSACTIEAEKDTMPGFYINEAGELICEYADGTSLNLGIVRGADGFDGKDGLNGTDGRDGLNGADGKDGMDGQDGKDGIDANRITIGANGHWYIDGVDTFYMAGKRDSIKVTEDTEPFDYERMENITISKAPKTDKEYDINNYKVSETLVYQTLDTDDIEDVFSYFDTRCREYNPDMNGLLVLPDTRGITSLRTTYSIRQSLSSSAIMDIICQMKGYLQLPDGREYGIQLVSAPMGIMQELSAPGKEWVTDVLVRYICNDGESFITNSRINAVKGIGSQFSPNNSCNFLVLNYKAQDGNPYEAELTEAETKFFINHNYAYVYIEVMDGKYDKDSTVVPVTEEEMYLITDEICKLLGNRFVVYDYEYYVHQFDGEKNV